MMGWSIGINGEDRDVGYGVPAQCDHPDCAEEIDRGLSYICGGEPDGGEGGCGLFFCGHHLYGSHNLCDRCYSKQSPFTPKPDHPDWMRWKLRDRSWYEWREKNPAAVQAMRDALRAAAKDGAAGIASQNHDAVVGLDVQSSTDAKDATRWRFMTAVADDANGPEAQAMDAASTWSTQTYGDFDADKRPGSVVITEIFDRAIAAMSAATQTEGK